MPKEWIFQDEGYSGASLIRPGLEAVRDLAAEGHIEAVLIHSPDRLSRKYAYQVLLAEEFSKHGVELRFVKSPSVTTSARRYWSARGEGNGIAPKKARSVCYPERRTAIDT